MKKSGGKPGMPADKRGTRMMSKAEMVKMMNTHETSHGKK